MGRSGAAAGIRAMNKLAIAPTVIHAAALWGLGVVGGYIVAFGGLWGPPWGIAGMWLMQSVALALAALLLVGFCLGLPQFRRSILSAVSGSRGFPGRNA